MNENNYECPKCHNIFPLANKLLHDARCTASNPVPLNASRLVGFKDNDNKKKEQKDPIQHLPRPPKATTKRKIDSHINPINIKESIIPIPETFSCWLCGKDIPEVEREDHMLCHKILEEGQEDKPPQNQQQNPRRPPQNPNRPNPNSNQNRQPNNQKRPQQYPPQNKNRPPQNQNRPNQNQNRPQQNQNRPPQNNRQPQNQKRPPYNQNRQPQKQNNNLINNINIKRSFVPFDDLQIFDFNQVNNNINKINNPSINDIFNELPETEIDDISKLSPQQRNCIICLNDLEKGDKATMLPCVHFFHTPCVQEWLSVNNYCPVCKSKINKNK